MLIMQAHFLPPPLAAFFVKPTNPAMLSLTSRNAGEKGVVV